MADIFKSQEQIDGEMMLAMMRHAVGLDRVCKREAGYRNHYCAAPEAAKQWLVLVGLGLAEQGAHDAGGHFYFHVSKAGLKLLGVKEKP